jgi:hypothetical protein
LVLTPPALTKNDIDHAGQSLAVIMVGNATRGTVQLDHGVSRSFR